MSEKNKFTKYIHTQAKDFIRCVELNLIYAIYFILLHTHVNNSF